MRVEWDPANDRENRAKHGLGFDEVVVVVHTEPGDDVIRIIGARMATGAEEQLFYQHSGGRRR